MTVVEISSDDLLSITNDVWASYLDPDGMNPLIPVPFEGGKYGICGAIGVTGDWKGHVLVECSDTASRFVAAALLGIDDIGDVGPDDIGDALGELANVIGGNVKSLLPGICALSLPYVMPTTGTHFPSVTEVVKLELTWKDEPVAITVLQATGDEGAGT